MTDTDLTPSQSAELFLSSLKRPIRLLVAISGGSDSTGLLLALNRAIRDHGHSDISLCAATIDHALRAESADEARKVAALCARHAIPHVISRWTDAKPSSGISATAREARYRLLAELADACAADAILTAHTLDDQCETIAMRAARNDDETTLGLAGMAQATLYGSRIWIMRPFLNCRRADIRRDIIEQGEGWIDDPSNLDRRYERVRTRFSLSDAAPAAPSPLAAERRRALSQSAAELLRRHGRIYGQAVLHLDAAALSTDALTLRYALGGLLAVLGGSSHRPGRAIMDRVMAFVGAAEPGRMTAARCLLQMKRDGLYVLRENRAILPLELGPDETGLWDGRFRVQNGNTSPVVIQGGGQYADGALFAGLPDALARRARQILPEITTTLAERRSVEGLTGDVAIDRAIPHFEHFLPEFDLAFANSVATLLGKQPYPAPPRGSC